MKINLPDNNSSIWARTGKGNKMSKAIDDQINMIN